MLLYPLLCFAFSLLTLFALYNVDRNIALYLLLAMLAIVIHIDAGSSLEVFPSNALLHGASTHGFVHLRESLTTQ